MSPGRLVEYLALAWCGGVSACGSTYALGDDSWWPLAAWVVVWLVLAITTALTVRADLRSGVVR